MRTTMAILAILAATALAGSGAAGQNVRQLAESCAPCHGPDGVARDTEVPHLAGQNERYLANQLAAFKSGRRRHPEMRIMARELTGEEIDRLAAYYAGLPPR